MYQEERLIAIVEHMKIHRRISVETICDLYGVSRDTARRDMVKLEEQGTILRTRGGAILPTLSKDIPAYDKRLGDETGSKRAIGKLAASLIQDRDFLLMDASTTVRFAAEAMSTEKNVVVTNSIHIPLSLPKDKGIAVHLLGGQFNPDHHFIYGARTLEMLHDYHVDKLLLGICAITLDGLSTPFEEEGYVIREMLKRADQVILLADHSKFGKKQFHTVAGFEQIDIVITDRKPDPALEEVLNKHEVHIMLAEETMPS
ncbi:DeoR/GlpR transcriptional regulator [Paenibacillus thalictri]|uniref:DeoR/GlpR transcriptional regulator n=1 Tax=Paenibacillus thalictri TaxID=2527873 RepID=A0A4Q9DKB6_9BACL|nr:DeoR/GlpR family DNA-binding transcription regulator [Paenibacillus thalictri]TBL75176.1 DeoR/GlpR transcriptional regulator [Paenibacillus thalictri]